MDLLDKESTRLLRRIAQREAYLQYFQKQGFVLGEDVSFEVNITGKVKDFDKTTNSILIEFTDAGDYAEKVWFALSDITNVK